MAPLDICPNKVVESVLKSCAAEPVEEYTCKMAPEELLRVIVSTLVEV